MIFNEMSNSAISHNAVKESQYDLGIGGALMHVYENECNFNALMKAAALSEMKYYNENGGDLFVQEAGAFKGFIEKAKAFFLKVIEKIKSIGKKFLAKINQYTMSDKDFVKKYQKELLTRDLRDFEFEGYEFPAWNGNTSYGDAVSSVKNDGSDTQDDLNDIIEKNRGNIVFGGAMTESEYRDTLKEKLYGDKDTIKVVIRDQLSIISDTSKLTKEAEKEEKDTVKAVENMIKELDKASKEVTKSISMTNTDDENTNRANAIKYMNNKITVFKALSNDLTVYFGAKVKALADKNRQAKAICVKALSYKYKNESASMSGSYSDIFGGVEIV